MESIRETDLFILTISEYDDEVSYAITNKEWGVVEFRSVSLYESLLELDIKQSQLSSLKNRLSNKDKKIKIAH